MADGDAAPPGVERRGDLPVIRPDWPAPANVRAFVTTRMGGVSTGPYASLNLSDGTEDAPENIAANRRLLCEALELPAEPLWLRQVHGREVRRADEPAPAGGPRADAAWTDRSGPVCAVLVADCLPVLLCDREGECVAAVHAGWRGLAAGIVEAAVAALPVEPDRLAAWLGPAISRRAFEIGPEVRERLLDGDPGATACFARGSGDRWQADLYGLAGRRLTAAGVASVTGGGSCTHQQSEWFYSHRRDGPTGRMAAVVYLDPG